MAEFKHELRDGTYVFLCDNQPLYYADVIAMMYTKDKDTGHCMMLKHNSVTNIKVIYENQKTKYKQLDFIELEYVELSGISVEELDKITGISDYFDRFMHLNKLKEGSAG